MLAQALWKDAGGIKGKQTINRRELYVALYVLQRTLVRIGHVRKRPVKIIIHTDSDYVYKAWHKGG